MGTPLFRMGTGNGDGGGDLKPYTVTVHVDDEFNGTDITLYQEGQEDLVETATNGVAVFYPMFSGTWRAKASYESYQYDDEENGVDLTYFGSAYELNITLGHIHITVEYMDEFNGAICTLTNGNKTFLRTLNTSGTIMQTVNETGTWVASATAVTGDHAGEVFSDQKEITEDGNYTLSIKVSAADGFQAWLDSAGITKTFNSLEAVLEDESTVRELMTKHASSDYLVDWYNDDIANGVSPNILETIMEYKGVIDILTSKWTSSSSSGMNGTISGNFGDPWKAFDRNETVESSLPKDGEYAELAYEFNEPQTITKLEAIGRGTGSAMTFKLQYYDTTWNDIPNASFTLKVSSVADTYVINLPNNIISARKYRLYSTAKKGVSDDFKYREIKFYGPKIPLGAKWLGLRDYVCDKFMAIDSAKQTMLASDNWEYILKDHAPIMTSATAPYGNVTATSGTTNPYYAFNGNTSNGWLSDGSAVNSYVQYEFTNPITVDKVSMFISNSGGGTKQTPTFRIEASNDSSFATKTTLIATMSCPRNDNWTSGKVDIINNQPFKYFRITCTKSWRADTNQVQVNGIQFYGRSLNVSVPKMSSNTEPYGEAFASTEYTTYKAYKAFDNDNSSQWSSDSKAGGDKYIGYDYGKEICVKSYKLFNDTYSSGYSEVTVTLKGSNDKNWLNADILDTANLKSGTTQNIFKNINNKNKYRYYAVFFSGYNQASSYNVLTELNFFGVDYSERDFAEDSKVEYICDNGYVPSGISLIDSGFTDASYSFTKPQYNANDIQMNSSAGTNESCLAIEKNLQDYKLIRMTLGHGVNIIASNLIGNIMLSTSKAINNQGRTQYKTDDLPYWLYHDVSAENRTLYILVQVWGGMAMNIKEWWLERS